MKSTKRIKPKIGKKIPIALDSPIVFEELPFNYVHYPNHYGTFFGFSEGIESQIYFCKCSESSINNYLNLNVYELSANYIDKRITSKLSNHFFSNKIVSMALSGLKVNDIIKYGKKLCHRCNMSTPTLRYCHEMYGGNFKQLYGWYINQTSLRIGIRNTNYLKEITPDYLIDKIEEIKYLKQIREKLTSELNNFELKSDEINELDKKLNKSERSIQKEIENITRVEFGFRKIGEGNVSETILTKIVKKIYFEKEVICHYRPKWLEGLELDIFIPDFKIGIEYQGQQHFYPIKAWGGESSFEKLKIRDQKKKQLCKQFGIKLIEIDYTEPLEFNYIRNKILT